MDEAWSCRFSLVFHVNSLLVLCTADSNNNTEWQITLDSWVQTPTTLCSSLHVHAYLLIALGFDIHAFHCPCISLSMSMSHPWFSRLGHLSSSSFCTKLGVLLIFTIGYRKRTFQVFMYDVCTWHRSVKSIEILSYIYSSNFIMHVNLQQASQGYLHSSPMVSSFCYMFRYINMFTHKLVHLYFSI